MPGRGSACPRSSSKRHLLGGEALGPELRQHSLAHLRRGCCRQRPRRSAPAPDSRQLRTSWCSMPANSRPSALNSPGSGGTSDAADAQLAGQPGGVDRAGAAEGQQREPARVAAALGRDGPQRPHHPRVGDAVDALGGLRAGPCPAARRCGRGWRGGRPRRRSGPRPSASWPGADVAEHDVGVGDGRLRCRRGRSRPARARRRRCAARRAGRPPGRGRRCCRRRRRPRRCRCSARGSVSPPPPTSRLPAESDAPTSYSAL